MARQVFQDSTIWNKIVMSSNDDTLIQNVGCCLLLCVKSIDVAPVEVETGLILNTTDTVTIPSTKFMWCKGKTDGFGLTVEVI